MEQQANGITVAYDLSAGSGPVVTLIHALGADRSMWRAQLPALAPRFRVMTYDVRGHGRSSKPAGPYSLSLFAADLQALLAALGIARTHLVGISMGGMIAQALAFAHPESIASLTLADTSGAFDPAARETFLERAALVEREGLAPIVEGTLDRWFTARFRREHPDVVDSFRQTLLANDPRAYAAAARAVADLDFTARLATLDVPTLVVVGADDVGTPPAMAALIHARVRGSRLLVLSAAAHLSVVEQAEQFNDALVAFLQTKAS